MPPVLANPTLVLGVAAVFQGWSWRVSLMELERHQHAGESLGRASQRDMGVLVAARETVQAIRAATDPKA